MWRAFPWILSIVLLIAFTATFSELQRMRRRFGEVTRHTFHDHADVRLAIIRSAMAQESAPIVILGDSFAELARFPSDICGRPVVNAGIGSATVEELTKIARTLDTASLVVVVAGTNNAGSPSAEEDFSKLFATIRPPKIAVAATAYPEINRAMINAAKQTRTTVFDLSFSEFADAHPTPNAYRLWTPHIVDAISEECAK